MHGRLRVIPRDAARLLHDDDRAAAGAGACAPWLAARPYSFCCPNKSAEVKILLALYGVSLLGGPFLLQWFFQAHDQMHWVASLRSCVRRDSPPGVSCSADAGGLCWSMWASLSALRSPCMAAFCIYVLRAAWDSAGPGPTCASRILLGHLGQASPIGLIGARLGFHVVFLHGAAGAWCSPD